MLTSGIFTSSCLVSSHYIFFFFHACLSPVNHCVQNTYMLMLVLLIWLQSQSMCSGQQRMIQSSLSASVHLCMFAESLTPCLKSQSATCVCDCVCNFTKMHVCLWGVCTWACVVPIGLDLLLVCPSHQWDLGAANMPAVLALVHLEANFCFHQGERPHANCDHSRWVGVPVAGDRWLQLVWAGESAVVFQDQRAADTRS